MFINYTLNSPFLFVSIIKVNYSQLIFFSTRKTSAIVSLYEVWLQNLKQIIDQIRELAEQGRYLNRSMGCASVGCAVKYANRNSNSYHVFPNTPSS